MKFLVFTTDAPPLAGLPTSGTALRTWGIAQGLLSHGHEVIISAPKSALKGLRNSFDISSLTPEVQKTLRELEEVAFDSSNQQSVVSRIDPDVLLCGHWPALTLPSKPAQPLIIDLAGPHMLERHYQGSPNQQGATLAKLSNLGFGDYFIVSGEKQRLYFLSYLLRASIENPEKRIVKIPMALSPEPAKRENSSNYPQFIFGGVFLPWQDPSHGLKTLKSSIEKKENGSLKLIGGTHPNYKIKQGIYTELFDELSKSNKVSTLPMMPYPDFCKELENCDAAIDLMKWNLERELAVTIRTTTFLWAGVPVIYNDYSDLSSLIKEYDAGWTIPPEDTAALASVVEEIYNSPRIVKQKSLNALKLSSELFSWDKAVAPLLNCITKPASKRLRETDIVMDFPDNASLPVSKAKSVDQYFTCRIDGLTRIECRLATHNKKIEAPVLLSLYELSDNLKPGAKTKEKAKLIARETLEPEKLSNNEWCSLDIDPLEKSAGRNFIFSVESESEGKELNASPWASKGSPYPLKGLYHGNSKVTFASLCLKTTCAGPSPVRSSNA